MFEERKEPDCTVPGNIDYWKCTGCGKTFYDEGGENPVTDTVMPAVGHKVDENWDKDEGGHWHNYICGHGGTKDYAAHKWDKGTELAEASCMTEGIVRYTCVTCDYYRDEYTDYGEHKFAKEWQYDEGGHWHESLCGHPEANDFMPHDFDEGVYRPDKNETVFTCKECKYEMTEVAPCNHTFDTSRWETDGMSHWHPATCGHFEIRGDEEICDIRTEVTRVATCRSKGETRFYCPVCDNEWTAESDYDYNAHDWDEGVVVREGTCTLSGEVKYTCGLCGQIKNEYTGLGDHQYSVYASYDATYHWYRAECEHGGESGRAEHDWHNGSCSECEAGLYYMLGYDEDGYTLGGVGCEELKSVVVPKDFTVPTEYNGKPVTKISAYAFRNNTKIETLTIPAGIEEIGEYAFAGCSSMRTVVVGESVAKIGANAFDGCTNLKRIIVKSEKTGVSHPQADYLEIPVEALKYVSCGAKEVKLTGSGAIPSESFRNADYMTKITLPEGLTGIGDGAFYGCTGLDEIDIPDGVTSIGIGAFYGCTGLSEIVIPDTVSEISRRAFYGCTGLGEAVLPSGITEISEYAFYGCVGLSSVTVKSGVKSIGDHAFNGCGLKELDLPSTVESIGYGAFEGCNITDLVLPEGVVSLGWYAFRNNPIEHVKLPLSVAEIAATNDYSSNSGGTFANCPIERAEVGAEAALFLPMKILATLEIYGGTRTAKPENYTSPKNLVTLKIADTVKYISDGAFENCTALTAIEGGAEIVEFGAKAFAGCTALSFTLPEKTETIGESAFKETLLTSVNLTALKSIGVSAFEYCSLLTSVSLSGSFTVVESRAFHYCLKLTDVKLCDTVKSIGEKAFYYADIASMDLPQALTEIGASAFEGCKKLQAVIVPSGVNHIASGTFDLCTSLTDVTLHDGILSIGASAFGGCPIVDITLPDALESIGSDAFAGCPLSALTLPSNLKSIGKEAFFRANFASLVIPASVTYVGKHAFSRCAALETVTVEDGASGFTDKIFDGCNIKYATVPAAAAPALEQTHLLRVTVTSGNIPESAFDGCTTLTDAVLDDTVKTIGAKAFYNCTALKNLTCYAAVFGKDAFAGKTGGDGKYDDKLYTEKVIFGGSVSDWMNAEFANAYSNPIASKADCRLTIGGEDLTELAVPQDVTSVGHYVFRGYKALTCVKLHDGILVVSGNAFEGCNISTAYMPERFISAMPKETLTNAYLTHGTALADGAFSGYALLRKVSLADSFESISRTAFEGCDKLEYNVMKDSNIFSLGNRGIAEDEEANDYLYVVKARDKSVENCLVDAHTIAIADGAFDGCANLVSIRYDGDGFTAPVSGELETPRPVVLPSTVINIGDNDFGDCKWLNWFELNSSRYTSYDGVLYRGGTIAVVPVMIGQLKVRVQNGSSYGTDNVVRILDYCNEIKAEQFANRPQLAKIVIGSGVRTIGARAFYNCQSLTSVSFGSNTQGWYFLTESGDTGERANMSEITVSVFKSETFYGMRRSL